MWDPQPHRNSVTSKVCIHLIIHTALLLWYDPCWYGYAVLKTEKVNICMFLGLIMVSIANCTIEEVKYCGVLDIVILLVSLLPICCVSHTGLIFVSSHCNLAYRPDSVSVACYLLLAPDLVFLCVENLLCQLGRSISCCHILCCDKFWCCGYLWECSYCYSTCRALS